MSDGERGRGASSGRRAPRLPMGRVGGACDEEGRAPGVPKSWTGPSTLLLPRLLLGQDGSKRRKEGDRWRSGCEPCLTPVQLPGPPWAPAQYPHQPYPCAQLLAVINGASQWGWGSVPQGAAVSLVNLVSSSVPC